MDLLLIRNVRLPYTAEDGEFKEKAKARLSRLGVSARGVSFSIYKKSLDARDRSDICFTASVLARGEFGSIPDRKLAAIDIQRTSDPYAEISFKAGSETCEGRPLVVGMGPCGLFAAYMLAKQGYRPIIIDRGGSVSERVEAVNKFYFGGILDTDTNIQFGAGGAGTFSDGKLVTRIKDPACAYVLKTFVSCGADEGIMTSAKPHIGTDVLRGVVDNMLLEIERMGGEIRYHCKLISVEERADGCLARTSAGDIFCSCVVLAVGHSARDTYEYLMKGGFSILPKSFSVGVRIEHLQEDVDRSLYGELAGDPRLPKGEYALSDTSGERGVYTFCMCPGGEVVAAASEEGGVVVNGMSRAARDGRNANSAMLVSVTPEDFSSDVSKAIEFQRSMERAAFLLGGSDYSAPVLTVGDMLKGRCSVEPDRIQPSYMGGKVRLAPLYKEMPDFLYRGLCYGITKFERKLSCFSDADAVLSGFETRTSAPLRILRNEAFVAVGKSRIYPCGEGAGYAGGITSAACDGIKAAGAIIERFAPVADRALK